MRKRPLVVERGRYRTEKPVHGALLAGAVRQLRAELGPDAREPLGLFEISLPLGDGTPIPDDGQTTERVARLTALGFPVAVTRFARAFGISEFVRRYTPEPLRISLGVTGVVELLVAHAAPGQIGGGMQALGILLSEHVRIYPYPMPAAVFRERLARSGIDASTIGFDAQGTVGAKGLRLPLPIGHMYDYLLAAGWVVPLPALPESEPARVARKSQA